jgi:hypothetical protein
MIWERGPIRETKRENLPRNPMPRSVAVMSVAPRIDYVTASYPHLGGRVGSDQHICPNKFLRIRKRCCEKVQREIHKNITTFVSYLYFELRPYYIGLPILVLQINHIHEQIHILYLH